MKKKLGDKKKNLQLDISTNAPSSRDAPSFTARLALPFDSIRVVGDEAPRPKDEQERTKNDDHTGRQHPSHQLYSYSFSQICGHDSHRTQAAKESGKQKKNNNK